MQFLRRLKAVLNKKSATEVLPDKSSCVANKSPVLDAVCISMVKNEQDLIELFLRHNSRFFDLMFVLDNGSNDRSRDILLRCARELGNVVIADLPRLEYAQSTFMTQALKFIQSAVFADVFCFLDADEFIDCESKADFLEIARKVPVGSSGKMAWHTLIPNPDAMIDGANDPMEILTL